MTGFGDSLRTERERRGLSLEQVCAQTKIAERHLRAIEAERYTELPPGVFRRGMVKAYVSELALDLEPWMERFQQSYDRVVGPDPEQTAESWAAFAENVKRSRTSASRGGSLRWLGVLGLFLLLCAAGYAVWRFVLLPRLR